MKILWLVVCGLPVVLLSVRMEAKPLFDIQDLTQLLAREITGGVSPPGREAGLAELNGRVQVRPLRDLRHDTKSRRCWPRPPRKKPAKSKKKTNRNCYNRKLDRIGSVSSLGC